MMKLGALKKKNHPYLGKMNGSDLLGVSDIVYVHPENWGKMNPILTSIFFQMGWFNHRLENDLHNLRCERSLHGSDYLRGS